MNEQSTTTTLRLMAKQHSWSAGRRGWIKFPSRLTSSTRWRYQIFLARGKKPKKKPHNSNFLSPIAQLGGGGSCSRGGCLVLTLQMTPNQKPQLSLSPAGEICSALQPLPSESLIHGRVRALPNPPRHPHRGNWLHFLKHNCRTGEFV